MENHCRSITILAAEDDPDDRFLVQEAFQESQLDYELFFVHDGVNLMHYLKGEHGLENAANTPRPDLILLDLNMPFKDGRESLAEIKADTELCSIPVIVLTNSSNEDDVLHTYDLGGAGFINKPVTFAGLVDIVKGLNRYWFEIVELTEHRHGNGNGHANLTNMVTPSQ